MSTYHWKVKSIKKWNIIPQGIELDIIVKNRSGKPNIREISEALERKYNIKAPGGMSDSIFEFIKG